MFLCNSCCGALCAPCLTQYAHSAIADRLLLPLRCADQKCRAPLPLSALNGLVSKEHIFKLSRFQCEMLQEAPAVLPPDPVCIKDVETQNETALKTLICDMGWQRCPDCGTGIERTIGCAHMVCVCGGEFCYSCGETWSKCGITCPRRRALPLRQDALLHLLPGRFEQLRDEVWERMMSMLERLREHLECDFPARLDCTQTNLQPPPTQLPALRIDVGGHNLPSLPTTSGSPNPTPSETRPVKMRLRSLVHPSMENKL